MGKDHRQGNDNVNDTDFSSEPERTISVQYWQKRNAYVKFYIL